MFNNETPWNKPRLRSCGMGHQCEVLEKELWEREFAGSTGSNGSCESLSWFTKF